MSIRKSSYIKPKFVSKKVISVVLMFTMITLFTAGCGRKSGSIENQVAPPLKESSQKEQLPQNSNTSAQDKNTNKNANSNSGSTSTSNKSSNTSAATDTKLQEVTAEMDKLGSTLDGLDNSSEISTTESIINNIN